MNSSSNLTSFRAGSVSNLELRSTPANRLWLIALMRSASSGPMPPLSRKGTVP